MVALGGLAHAALLAAMTAGAIADPSSPAGAGLEMTPDVTIAGFPARHLEACDSGGLGSPSCDVTCHVVFNFMTSQCGVSCRSGYYACCSCDDGCHCIIDHDEMWPLPPDRDLEP